MNTTITTLRQELEELEKRIKSISSAQTSLSQLVAIREYFEKVQTYLSTLQTEYENHTLECEEYSTQISDLQNQINEINTTLESLPSSESEITDKITSLEERFTTLSADLDAIKNGSDTNLGSLESDISLIQTDIGYINDEIDSIQSEITAINTQIGSLQTTVNNLNTTQNSLSATQSSLSSRLTTAENNISALTGGVDVSGLDERISSLESTSKGDSYIFRDHNYGLTSTSGSFTTREYYFVTTPKKCVKEIFTLNYQSAGTGALSVEIIINDETVKSLTIDLASNPSNCTFPYMHIANYYSNGVRLKLTTEGEFTLSSLTMEVVGSNLEIYNHDHDLTVACYNGVIYLTRQKDGVASYGMFTSSDVIDIDNLPYTATTSDEICEGYSSFYFMPRPYCYGTLLEQADVLFREGVDGYFHGLIINKNGTTALYNTKTVSSGSGQLVSGFYDGIRCFVIKKDTPHYFNVEMSNSDYDFVVPSGTSWKFIEPVYYNEKYVNDEYYAVNYTKCLALSTDGYFYYFQKRQDNNPCKIAKGIGATGYIQLDDSVHVYITDGSKVDKYILTQATNGTYSAELSTTYDDTDRFYETYDGLYFRHVVSTDTWAIEKDVIVTG